MYDTLISETPDRGKETKVLVDWSNPDLLKQMVRRRLLFNLTGEAPPINELWNRICVPLIEGEDTLNYLIDRSLMRPRFLLHLINYCKGNAINFGRSRIDEDDITDALEVYSTDVITEVDHEIRDIFPAAADMLYVLLGEPRELTLASLMQLIAKKVPDSGTQKSILELFFWHGVLGLKRKDEEVSYIYNVNYDLKRLSGLVEKYEKANTVLRVNPAFWRGLEMVE